MVSWVSSLEDRARAALPEPVFAYYRSGARAGLAAAEAAAAWDRLRLLPHVLRDVTEVDTSTSALGTPLSSPFAVAPTTLHRAAHPEGELAMASAVAASGSLLVVSSNSGATFEAIGATGVRWWLQVYLTPDRPACVPMLTRAVEAGAAAVVLTVDTAVVGTKYGVAADVWDTVDASWLRGNVPEGPAAAFGVKATDLGPGDIGWLRETSGLPVVVKGVLRADDARVCAEAGAAGVWVSNHGGRQLDPAAATADCLASVRAELGPDAELYVDGGVRHGRHGFAALALGAGVVFLGRLPLYALAVDGPAGVVRLLEELEADLVETMRLTGCPDLDAVTPDLVAGGPPGGDPG